VELETRLSFTTHIARVSRKDTQSATAIGRLMPNVGGPAQAKCALLGSVTNSKLLYASATWVTIGIKMAKNRKAMARAQRITALRTIRAYRTVSAKASSVLSSMLLADLIVHVRTRIKIRLSEGEPMITTATMRSKERYISLNSWQRRWDGSKDGR